MLRLKKLFLASAIAVVSSSSFAMQSMDDSAMSEAVAQDGIDIITTLNIGTGNNTVMTYTDTSGITGGTYTNSGDLNIRQLKLSGTLTTKIDVGSDATNGALQINMTSPSLTVGFNGIDVCKTPGSGICATGTSVITTSAATSINITNFALNLQLGNAPQGHLGKLSSSSPIALTVGTGVANSVIVKDSSSANGGIGIGQLAVSNIDLGNGSTAATSTFLDVCAAAASTNCAAGNPGLVISFGSSTMSNLGVSITRLTLGDTSATPSSPIGNVTLTNLDLSGTSVRIVGHN